MMWNKCLILSLMAATSMGCTQGSSTLRQSELEHEVSLLGHRNWIVVADSAYPLQSREGITTMLSVQGQLETVRSVLRAINQAGHVRGKVYLDQEIDYVPEKNAQGINAYRTELKEILQGADTKKIPHEQLIAKLDEAAKTFNVLILKTDLTLPYTSVFFELDCAYWSGQDEAALRKALSEQ